MLKQEKLARILLLDDESEFVDACAAALKGSYHVVKTTSPFEAISLLDASRDGIDLVICDYNMPGMNGLELQQELRRMKVRVPLVLFTGQALTPEDHQRLSSFVKIIMKPFGREKLLAEVAALLEKSQAPSTAKGTVLFELEGVMKQLGVENPERFDPESSRKILGTGEAHHAFLAWYYLRAVKSL